MNLPLSLAFSPPIPRRAVTLRPAGAPRPEPRLRAITSDRKALGEILLEAGAITPDDLLRALALQARQKLRLGDILLAHGMVTQAALMRALAVQWQAEAIDPATQPPDPTLLDRLGAPRCLAEGLLPWRHAGGVTVIATSRPADFAKMRPALTRCFGPVAMALVPDADLHATILRMRGAELARRAEARTAQEESCRGSQLEFLRRAVVIVAAAIVAGLVVAPAVTLCVLLLWAVLAMILSALLKLAACVTTLRPPPTPKPQPNRNQGPQQVPAAPRPILRLPVVSILVPLRGEDGIAPRLIRRLARLNYPRELLDVILVAEADDTMTLEAVRAVRLPNWMRLLAVPAGTLRTKPRALNFALDFCRGGIVGVYDAEDAPAPGQIHAVVRRFDEAGPDLACVQGMLDYYNPRTNWISRCFTIDYAIWFRMVLPGIERLGLAVPLGGTTLFFRREVLERLGAWDAHNVTEDADLGIRLARHGYRTELLDTVTEEEANCRVLPWVRQRSRWLKGYAITYAVHMRRPRLLLRQLGWRKFLGVQVMFLGTISQAALAPLLWSFWLALFGFGHPLTGVLPGWLWPALAVLFLLTEAASLAVGMLALSGRRHRYLRAWVPALHVYFPLATAAVYKALWEIVTRPWYWDKTQHGSFDAVATAPATSALPRAHRLALPA